MALINCPECGREISDHAPACPNCGYPIAKKADTEANKADATRENNNAPENSGKPKKKKTGLVFGIIAVAVIAIAGLLYYNAAHEAAEQKAAEEAAATAREEYITNLHSIRIQMLLTAIEAERAGNLIHDVWYNTIYEKKDATTNKYTMQSSYSFNDDFNTSLRNLFTDVDFIERTDSIKDGVSEAAELFGALQNPPDDLSASYSALGDLYDAFLELTNCATNPTGSLQSYTSAFNKADSDFMKYYDKLDAVMPELVAPEIVDIKT